MLSAPTLIGAWIVLSIGVVLLAAVVAARPFFELVRVPAQSMYPTIQAGDRIVVDKRAHAVRRGDVILFKFPLDRDTRWAPMASGSTNGTFPVRFGERRSASART
jgi:signal peptidase I